MPIVTIQCRPKTPAQREAVSTAVITAVVDAFDVAPETVQVFIDEYDDSHWHRGTAPLT
jgi:4-oxalocrotonate tautomerase